jgi:hypothetical protein
MWYVLEKVGRDGKLLIISVTGEIGFPLMLSSYRQKLIIAYIGRSYRLPAIQQSYCRYDSR